MMFVGIVTSQHLKTKIHGWQHPTDKCKQFQILEQIISSDGPLYKAIDSESRRLGSVWGSYILECRINTASISAQSWKLRAGYSFSPLWIWIWDSVDNTSTSEKFHMLHPWHFFISKSALIPWLSECIYQWIGNIGDWKETSMSQCHADKVPRSCGFWNSLCYEAFTGFEDTTKNW